MHSCYRHRSFLYLYRQTGFTLIELIAVMVITGILAVTASVRFTPTDIDLQTAKSDVIAALVFARETAMARTDGNSSVQFFATANSVDVQVNNVSIANGHESYPLTLKGTVSITSGTGTLSFNTLGETDSHTLGLTQGEFSSIITISGVGYAY